jgi:hypothetical protein
MTFYQSLGMVALLIVMSNSRARYGIMASPPSVIISPQMLSGPTGLCLHITANIILMILVLMVKGSRELAHYICDILCSEMNTEE